MAVEQLALEGLEAHPPLTVDEFYALARRQGWDEDTRVELLDGEVVWMSPIGDPHAGCVNRLTRVFTHRYPEAIVLVSIQNPIHPGPYDEPQPDVTLLKPRVDDYGTSKPTAQDILLLVVVADTTVRTDLGREARIYVCAGVEEYWVSDLNADIIYVHRAPHGGSYRDRTLMIRGDGLSAQFLPAVQFSVDEILG